MIVEARTPGTVIYGTPAQFRRAAARLGTEEPYVCVEAIDAMAEAVNQWILWENLRDAVGRMFDL